MNVIVLTLEEHPTTGDFVVRGLAGAPALPGTLFSNQWPSAEDVLTRLRADGWQISVDGRARGTGTISLTHAGTPPRAPGDALRSSSRPPVRQALGTGYSIADPSGAATEHAARLDQIEADTLAGLRAIAADSRLSVEGKTENIQQARTTALSQIDAETESALRAVQNDLAYLEKQASVPLTPRPDEVALLAYQRDALQAQWTYQTGTDIQAAWSAALDSADLVSLRIFRDFAPSAIRAKPPWDIPGAEKAFPPRRVSDLLAASDRALMSADQRGAADLLPQIETARAHIQARAQHAHNALDVQFDPVTGSVKDGFAAAWRRLIQI